MKSGRRPILEATPQLPQESFHCEVVRGRGYGARWHFHPEHQITLVLRSAGHRVVGDNISPLAEGDLVLVGSNLPHVWHQDESRSSRGDAVHAVVLRFRDDFLGDHFLQRPELETVRRLLRRAARGLCVRGKTRETVARMMLDLAQARGMDRIMGLLLILHQLAGSSELRAVASAGFSPDLKDTDQPRMQRVLRCIHECLGDPVERADMARCAGLSEGAFSRFFKTRTGKTLPQYVNELRIGRACSQLARSDTKVADIALDCGFESLANFNRQFRGITGTTPQGYRRTFEQQTM